MRIAVLSVAHVALGCIGLHNNVGSNVHAAPGISAPTPMHRERAEAGGYGSGARCASSSRESIPWLEIGAKAGADYRGDGLSVTAVPQSGSARLRCAFQGLEGEATTHGLWLRSNVTNAPRD